ncbi:hypothetical protein A2Z33_01830 [Candidatus Gottesmanbacteria bacterium RBG_16_52_11]|uniref:arginine--tRNA ligase n=1 Tax=Candidatus Gottesmanbacteria bacterium RBG_16_52_11 TaxID=1798374 RepID=A0A1F5YRB5_9BACT|nr:MAG: hypothetical protein A2Z33_01830 [Candidatus Gottesmanbacteria bacterium RBG_16_52_11]
MKPQLEKLLQGIIRDLGAGGVNPQVSIPENPEHGEYTTNVALQLSKQLGKPPMDIALQVVERIKGIKSNLKHDDLDQNTDRSGQKASAEADVNSVLQDIVKVEAVPPGFINVRISEAGLSSQISRVLSEGKAYGMGPKTEPPETVMVEFAHPNTHKAFHIGHLRNIATGESVVRLLEATGKRVIRANYQGDVGMHIAKCLYSILQTQNSPLPPPTAGHEGQAKLPTSPRLRGASKTQSLVEVRKLPISDRVKYLGEMYAAGSHVYETDAGAKQSVHDLNFLIYAAAQRYATERGLPLSTTDYMSFVKSSRYGIDEIYALWKETRQWSLDYFEAMYRRVWSHFDRYYFESECLAGVDIAKDAVRKGILKESDGAIIFDGKPYGLDTRVFVNSMGLPTYEGKELALSAMEFTEFGHLNRLIHVVGPEQSSFFSVTFKAEELLNPELFAGKQKHLVYGWVRLKKGKMSSRMGNVILGEWLVDEVRKYVNNIIDSNKSNYKEEEQESIAEIAAIAAIKYAFLRVSTTQEIAFDLAESVSMEGDSGPYLLYAYARAKSVLRKAKGQNPETEFRNSKRIQENEKFEDSEFVSDFDINAAEFNREERSVARLILHFPDIVRDAAESVAPSMLCNYLFRLAAAFNLFYAKHAILNSNLKLQNSHLRASFAGAATKAGQGSGGQAKPQLKTRKQKGIALSEDSDVSIRRLALTTATAQVLKNGLQLLGIETLERM